MIGAEGEEAFILNLHAGDSIMTRHFRCRVKSESNASFSLKCQLIMKRYRNRKVIQFNLQFFSVLFL